MSLSVCPSCTRHRRVSDPSCPFCGDTRPVAEEQRRAATLTRVALVVGVSAVVAAAGAGGCIALSHRTNVAATNAAYGGPGGL
jgi:hypothetical protein